MRPCQLRLAVVSNSYPTGSDACRLAQLCERRYAYELHHTSQWLAWWAEAARLYRLAEAA
jgi:hypothetical protein